MSRHAAHRTFSCYDVACSLSRYEKLQISTRVVSCSTSFVIAPVRDITWAIFYTVSLQPAPYVPVLHGLVYDPKQSPSEQLQHQYIIFLTDTPVGSVSLPLCVTASVNWFCVSLY